MNQLAPLAMEEQQSHTRTKDEEATVDIANRDDDGCRDLIVQDQSILVLNVDPDESTVPNSRPSDNDGSDDLTGKLGTSSRETKLRQSWGDCHPHVALLREALQSSAPDIAVLGPLNGCFSFYMTHIHNEVLSSTYAKTMFFGAGVTPLESAFMWLGSWRPTSALVLVYSLMEVEIENALNTVRSGRNLARGSTASLLSTRQLSVMHMLQKHTQHAEMKISKKLAVLQMLIGDQDMLEAVLLDAASSIPNDSSRFRRATEKKMSRFRRILVQAEELRLHTLQDLLSLLTPIQAARCCVALFEICFSMREMGSALPPRLPVVSVNIAALPPPTPISRGILDMRTPPLAGFVEPCFSFHASSTDHTLMNPSHISTDGPSDESNIPFCSSSSSSSLPQHIASSSPPQDSYLVNRSNGYLLTETAAVPDFGGDSDNRDSTSQFRCDEPEAVALPVREFEFDFVDHGLTPLFHETGEAEVPLIDLELRPVNRNCPPELHQGTANAAPRPTAVDPEEVILNRLLILSPSSSDVAIKSCSLNAEQLPFFEIHRCLSAAVGECETTDSADMQYGSGRPAPTQSLARLSDYEEQHSHTNDKNTERDMEMSLSKLGLYD